MQLNLDFMHELNLYHACSINSSGPLSGEASCSTACLATRPTSITLFFRHARSVPQSQRCYHCPPPSILHPFDYLYFFVPRQLCSHFSPSLLKAAALKLEGNVPAALISATEIPPKTFTGVNGAAAAQGQSEVYYTI